MIEPRFVGAGRHAVVDGLLAAFDSIRDGGPGQWIMLEAPSGWGKTRVLHEFYRRLAAHRQDAPPYWPESILDGSGPALDDVASRRKRLVPDVVHNPGSLPNFMWWGVTCSSRGGVVSAALRADLGQVEAHAEYLDDAWREVASSRGRWATGLRDAGVAAADEAAMEVAGTAIEGVLGAAIPGLGLVRWLGERGVASVRASAERRERLASTDRIEAADLVADTAAMIGRLAVPGLPVVIAVEDLHDADSGLADLLAALVGGSASVLVVSTSWPGRSADNSALRHALDNVGDRVVRLDHRAEHAPEPFGPDASLGELERDALSAMVRDFYPAVDEATLAAIVDRYPNPLTLELFCQLPRVRRRGRNGTLSLDPATVADAPAEIRGLYMELWKELPEAVREALSLAALGIPALIETSTASEWNTDLLLAALAELDWPSIDEVSQALRSGGDAYSWARTVSSMLRRFNETDQLDIAADDDSFLFADDRVEVRTALGAAIGGFLDTAAMEPAERHHLADLAAVLHAEGFITDADVLADAVRPSAELAWDDQRDLDRVIALLSRVIAAGPSTDRADRAQLLRGHANLLAGRLSDALADAEAVATDVSATLEIERLNLRAKVLAALRHSAAAVDAYRLLVSLLETELGARAADTIAARAGLAAALESDGRPDEALTLLRQVVAQGETVLAPDDAYVLALRNSLAASLSNRGMWDEATEVFMVLRGDCERVLGLLHPRTLNVVRNAAFTLLSSGRRDEAVAILRATVGDHHRAFGADHPDTFRSERFLGLALGQGDDVDEIQEGVDLLVAMHSREVDALGWDHPDVQDTRGVVARLALASGQYELALDVLNRRVVDAERLYGRPSIPLASAEVDLAHALLTVGRVADVIATLEQCLEELDDLVEVDSELAVAARRLLGWAQTGTGGPTEDPDAPTP